MVLDFLFNKKDTSKNADGEVSLEVVDPRTIDSHCLIAGNLHIRGEVFFSGTLRVDGRIDGKVSIYEGGKGQLVVSKGAAINGPVHATSILTDGLIAGEVMVDEKIECRPNATLRGEVTYGSISIGDGAKIEAKCRQKDQPKFHDVNRTSPETTKPMATDFLSTKAKK